MRKLLLLIALISIGAFAQPNPTGTSKAGKFQAFYATKKNDATRIVVQDSITGMYHWILKTSLGGGGDFIPLSGTTTGNPVTGDIEMQSDKAIKSGNAKVTFSGDGQYLNIENSFDGIYKAGVYFDGNQISLVRNSEGRQQGITIGDTEGITAYVSDDDLSARGFSGLQDFTANITDLDYTQKKYVDDAIAAAGGSGTVTSVTGTNGVTVASGTTTPVIGLGNITPTSVNASGNIQGATYGSDGSVSDAELLRINSLTSNAQTQLDTNAAAIASNTSAIALKADDSATVHKTGAETIAGVKTFSSTISGSIDGNAATVTTNANLTGDVTSSGNATTYNNVVPANKGGAGTVSGLLKANGSGVVSAAVNGTDYNVPQVANNLTSSSTIAPSKDAVVAALAGKAAAPTATDYSATSTIVGWSSFTTKWIYIIETDKEYTVYFDLRGVSDSASATFTVPFTAAYSVFNLNVLITNNSIDSNTPGQVRMAAGSNVVTLRLDRSGGGFATSNNKQVTGQLSIPK